MRKNLALVSVTIFFTIVQQASAMEAEASTDSEFGYQTHASDSFVPKDFDYAVETFSTKRPVFDQESYEETVQSQAEMMVTLEALRMELNEVSKEMADIEVYIYGNSQDIHDNYEDMTTNGSSMTNNKHTMHGMMDRVSVLVDACRHNQAKLDEKRDALILYCQQFAYAPEMNQYCAKVLECRETELPKRYQFNGSNSYGGNSVGGNIVTSQQQPYNNNDHHHVISPHDD